MATTESIEIPIKVIDEVSDPVNKASDSFEDLTDNGIKSKAALNLLSKALDSAIQLAKDSYAAYTELAESVRDLSLISGESTESTSRFIEVLDDFQLTAEDATSAARFLKEKGLSPSVETLARLSDEFKKIKDPAERMSFVQENLGRGGAKWVNVLNQGGDALRQMSEEVSKNLILTEEQIRLYEVQRIAIESQKGRWQEFKVKVGEVIGQFVFYNEAAARANEIWEESGRVVSQSAQLTEEYKEILREVKEGMLESADANIAYNESLAEQEVILKAVSDARQKMSDDNMEFMSVLENMQSAEESYSDKAKDLTQERIDLEKEKADLISLGYQEQSSQIQEINDELEENSLKAQENADEHELANRKIVLGLLERKLTQDGILDDKELQWLLEKGEAWGIYSETVVSETQKAIAEANALTNAIAAIPSEKVFTLYVNQQGDIGAQHTVEATGQQQRRNAFGGSWVVPQRYGNEGYHMAGGQTASAGEVITVTPANQIGSGNSDVVAAIYATRIDEQKLARILKEVALQDKR